MISKKLSQKETTGSFVEHYSCILSTNKNQPPKELCTLMEFRVLQNMNPISVIKTIGTDLCKLYTEERIRVLKYSKRLGTYLINKYLEVHCVCRLHIKFHWFPLMNGTDDVIQVAER